MSITNFKCVRCKRIFTQGVHKVEVVKWKKKESSKGEKDMGVCPDCGELMEICTRLK